MSDRSAEPATRMARLPVLLALVPFALLVARFDWLCDDAYISFRYAKHLSEGLGLTYNPGTEPPVEGYSNLLWVLWAALWEVLGGHPGLGTRATSALCGAVLVLAAAREAARCAPGSRWAGPAAAWFLATLPPFAVWSTSGLETMPFALALFLVHGRTARRARPGATAVAGAAAVLLRTDGPAWVLLALATGTLARERAPGAPRPRIAAGLVPVGAAALGVAAAQLAFRLGYHGDWVANTVRAKVGLSADGLGRGLAYVAGFGLTFTSFPLAIVLALAARRRTALAGALFALAACAYAVLVGGDFMAMGRFLVPCLAPLAVGLGLAVARLPRAARAPLLAGVGALSLLPGFGVHVVPGGVREATFVRGNALGYQSELEVWRGMKERAEEWSVLGRAVKWGTPPDASLIAGAIGALGYWSEREILDRNGLVDREVARRPAIADERSPGHFKFVPPEFFRDRDPTYFWVNLVDVATGRLWFPERFGRPLAEPEFDVEHVPLPEHAGFPPGVALRLVRWR